MIVKKKRVAVIVRSLKIGGMERVAVNLSEAFAEEKWESHLIYFKDKNRAIEPNKDVRVHHFNLDRGLNLTVIGTLLKIVAKFLNGIFRNSFFLYIGMLNTPIFRWKLKQIEKEYGKFDLIVMRGHGTFEEIWWYKDNRVVQMVESVFIRNEKFIDKLYIKCLYSGKNLAGVSSGVKEKIEEVLRKTKTRAKSVNVIYNPLNIDDINKKANEYTPDIETNYIVSVGRITPNKNISFLLEAYKYARNEYNLTLPLVIIGNGHDMENVKRKIAELSLEKYVILKGLLVNPYPWIKHASCLTSTSYAEGFGMVLLEALTCHTKVIATRSQGGVQEIMTGNLAKYLVDFDAKIFAKKMYDIIIETKEWDFQSHIQRFQAKEIVNKYEEFYL